MMTGRFVRSPSAWKYVRYSSSDAAALGGIAISASGASASARRAYSVISAASRPCTPSTSAALLPRALDSTSIPRIRSSLVRYATLLDPCGHTMPWHPHASTNCASRTRSSQSTAPDSVNGVDRIMKAPRIAADAGAGAASPARDAGPSADAGSTAADASAARQSRRLIELMACSSTLRQREADDEIAAAAPAFAAARRDGHELLAVHHVDRRRREDAGAGVELPQKIAGLRVE